MTVLEEVPKTIGPATSPLIGARFNPPRSAIVALVLYLLLNLCFNPWSHSRADSNGMSQVVEAFVKQQDTAEPYVVILGSSVAKHLQASIPQRDLQISRIGNMTFNLQLISDGYILSEKFLHNRKHPQLLVWAVTPRDFVDNDVKDITRTSTFRKTVQLHELLAMGSVLKLDFADYARAAYNAVCCFYDQRSGVQKLLETKLNALYDRLLKNVLRGPIAESSSDNRWNTSLREYLWRYQGISENKLAPQMSVLRQTIRRCRERGIKVLLVNMPLSQQNLDLLPNGFYSQFRNKLRSVSQSEQCQYFDCAEVSQFSDNDFIDCAHLKLEGGRKLFTLLRPLIEKNIKRQP